MSTTPMVQPHHLRRKAVIYIRQSTGHQVLTNIESQQLQRAMREHAHHLGWPDERIEVVETDLGRTAQSTERRNRSGCQNLTLAIKASPVVPSSYGHASRITSRDLGPDTTRSPSLYW